MSEQDVFTELDEKINDFIFKHAKKPEYLVLKPETINRLYMKIVNSGRYVDPSGLERYNGIKVVDATKVIMG